METAQYLCEFFFGNFWHFLQLCILCLALSKSNSIHNHFSKKGKDDDAV